MLLNRYILWNFLRNLGMLFAALISLYLLIDFFEKIDNFLEKGKAAGLILKFFVLNIPFIIEQMSPVCVLLAGVITLGVLNHTNACAQRQVAFCLRDARGRGNKHAKCQKFEFGHNP